VLTLLVDAASSPQSVPTPTFLWLMVLFGTVSVAVAAVVIDNRVKNVHKTRPHNSLLLVNECLAEHQSAYLVYFIALLNASDFSRYWIKPSIGTLVIIAIALYVVGVSITADHEKNIKRHHPNCPEVECRYSLPNTIRFRILWFNLFSTAVLLSISVVFATYAIRSPGPG
jgi:hypothetical protein